MAQEKKSFCGNLLCYKRHRTHQCSKCGISMCGLCSYKSQKFPNEEYCIDCCVDLAFESNIEFPSVFSEKNVVKE